MGAGFRPGPAHISEPSSPESLDFAEVDFAPPRSPTERPSSCRYVVPPLIYLKDRIRNAIVETCTETLGLCNDLAEMIADFTGVPGVVKHEPFCSDNEFQVYVVDTSTWTGVQHHGDNVYFDTYECGVVEIRITAEVTEPESITELNVGDVVLAKEPHSRKRTY